MFCDACRDFLKDRKEMATLDSDEPVEYRRQAAIILLSLARGRKRTQSMQNKPAIYSNHKEKAS